MNKKIIIDGVELEKSDLELSDFDAAEMLDDEETIAAYLALSLEEDGVEGFLQALNTAARAKGMLQIAKETGLARESIYKTLSGHSKPRFETVYKIAHSLGLSITFAPRHI